MTLLATDLDGTLTGSNGQISPGNLQALRRLGDAGVVRVVATGRSAFAARKLLQPDAPIDYLVVSSGAGVIDWRSGQYLRTIDLAPDATAAAAAVLTELALDFMVHHPIPDNHRFAFWRAQGGADFEHRVSLYRGHCEAGQGPWALPASQLLAVHSGADDVVAHVRARLPEFTVLRATSPLDRRSAWIEVFPTTVSKSQACAFITERCGLAPDDVFAVGNDTNDVDLLHWAGTAFIVGDAHASLLDEFSGVGRADDDGFAEVAALACARARR